MKDYQIINKGIVHEYDFGIAYSYQIIIAENRSVFVYSMQTQEKGILMAAWNMIKEQKNPFTEKAINNIAKLLNVN